MDLKPKDIKGSDYNPRIITEEERLGLKSSIDLFQNISGIVYNIKKKCLISGHRRWEELNGENRKITLKKIEKNDTKSVAWYQIISDGEYSTFDLRVVDWELNKEQAANVAANSHAISGKFDNEILSTLLDSMDFDLKKILRMDALERDLGLSFNEDWNTDIEAVEKVEANNDGILGKIFIECKSDDREELLYYIKDKLMESGFEGVHLK